MSDSTATMISNSSRMPPAPAVTGPPLQVNGILASMRAYNQEQWKHYNIDSLTINTKNSQSTAHSKTTSPPLSLTTFHARYRPSPVSPTRDPPPHPPTPLHTHSNPTPPTQRPCPVSHLGQPLLSTNLHPFPLLTRCYPLHQH